MSFVLASPPCSSCKLSGIPVRLLTVKSIIKKEFRNEIKDKAYYLCMNPGCQVAYYTVNDPNDVLTKDKVKVPIWFKTDADPRYACYCNKITYKEAFQKVVETGLEKSDEIIMALRENKKCACTAMNPSGQCCTPLFTQAIEDGLKQR